jgi:dTDP-4-amino-4,6-dideoxygalactose transaminase
VSLSVPQAAPGAAIAERRSEYMSAIARVLDSGVYVLGDEVAAFEREFATFVGTNHCVGVANGTDAIEIALLAVGIRPGDGVVTVSHTAGATVAAVLRLGAIPILVDVLEATFTIDPQAVERALARPFPGVEIRAIVPVHLYGAMADVRALKTIAQANGLKLVEDCAQAHGASLDGVAAGQLGDAAAFSFYPTKNLAAIGDGGAVVTNAKAVADAARKVREYGWRRRQVVEGPGFNSRLDELQAALLRVGLDHLDEDNARRIAIANAYDAGLQDAGLVLPTRRAGLRHVFHQYVARTPQRDALRAWCKARGVVTSIHYPMPIHLQPGFAQTTIVSGDLTMTERLAGEIISLPMFPQLTTEQVGRVVEVVRAGAQLSG